MKSSAYSRRKSYKQWKGWRADPELDYRSNMASRVPIATMLPRTRNASKRDRNSLIECIHLLYRTVPPRVPFVKLELVLIMFLG